MNIELRIYRQASAGSLVECEYEPFGNVESWADPTSESEAMVASLAVLGPDQLAVLDEALRIESHRLRVDFRVEVDRPVVCEDGRSLRNEVA